MLEFISNLHFPSVVFGAFYGLFWSLIGDLLYWVLFRKRRT